ncbi:MAG: sulfatase-like hydrolase/transferase [Flavobacteriaceae bacterium]|jgi:arylsulfatase A-like enzyme|nr:sulfatase-like hydrolase/transferase [Flavobacteriaceae bacterium]MDG1965436.1 sulfatase-like hydrolase/transferase [Flavobacteriaceae bacterium]
MKKNKSKILSVFSLIMVVFTVLGCMQEKKKTSQKNHPNVIVIMTDDLGYVDVGFNGSVEIPTPNIDRIAQQGVKFTNGYTPYSVCSPSRAGFITGRYQQRFGYERNAQYRPNDPNMGLPQTEKIIPEVIGQVGYTSGVIGKWHLGAHISNHPLNRGFDFFYGHLGGGHRYFPEELTIEDSYSINDEPLSYRTWIMRDHQAEKTDEYLTDEFSNEAVKFVEKNKEGPFFLYLAYNAPHGPLQATQKYLDRFDHIEGKKRKTYAAMVSAVDDGVGRILDRLESLGIAENTMIFFLSDNGGPEPNNASNNGPLREGKSSIYEGGNRVPFAMQWTSQIAPMVYEYPISSLDILPTIAALTHAPLPADKPLDGVNIIPFLKGEKQGRPHQTLYVRKFDNDLYSVRDGDMKLVTKKKNSLKELYNLQEDLGEENNLANEFPEEVKRLDSLRQNWDKQLIDPIFLGLIHTDRWKKRSK